MQRMQNIWMRAKREQNGRQDAERVAKALLRSGRRCPSRFGWGMRTAALVTVLTTGGLPLTLTAVRAQEIGRVVEAHMPRVNWNRDLKPGTTDRLTPAQWKAVDAQRAKEAADKETRKPDVRALTLKEMQTAHGSGPYRNAYFAGTLPWHRSIRDVNMCNGNLFKSFTDIQVAPGRGAGLAMQRTYNSQDSRPGPFGVGWQQCYDIRMEEENPTTNETSDSLNYADRTDFFGAKHKYHRDADGLYSPPPYLFDETSSTYQQFLVNGPVAPLDDTQIGMDGTVKHFVKIADNWRACDYIQDRYGSKTTLAYGATVNGAAVPTLLASVTDPVGRQLVYHWTNFGTNDQPVYRITGIDGPQYSVAYAYNGDANLASVTLDSGDASHLNRTTTYGYQSYSGDQGTETGLLSSVTDPLGHTLSYTYTFPAGGNGVLPATGTVWPTTIVEPAGVDTNGNARAQTWNITAAGPDSASPLLCSQASTNGNAQGQNIDAGLYVRVLSDTRLRVVGTMSNWNSDGPVYITQYDTANDVTASDSGYYYVNWANFTGNVIYGTHKDVLTYGPHGNQLLHTAQGFADTDATRYYDGSQLFQKKTVTDANGHVNTFGVGSKYAGLPIEQDPDPANHDTNAGDRGSVLWVKDAKYGDGTTNNTGTRFAYQYNVWGQKISETNQKGVVMQYTYGDAWGNLTSVVQDPAPSPSDGQTHLNRVTSMTYDIAGHVLTSTDPMGHVSTFTYNNLGQPVSASFPATTNAQGVQVTTAETVSYVYDLNGRANSVSDNRGTTTLTYESGCDRVSSVSDPVTGTTGYTYGASGERASMTLPGGGTWTYQYAAMTEDTGKVMSKNDPNSIGRRLTSITDDQGRRIDVALDSHGALAAVRTNQTFTTGASPQLLRYQQTDYGYDAGATGISYPYTHMRLTQIRNTWHYIDQNNQWQSKPLVSNAYTYDAVGQRLTNTLTSVDPATGQPTSRTEQYAYDELNRLTNVDYGDGQTQSYAFDSMGNRASKTDAGGGIGGTEAYTYNAANMLLSRAGNPYISDANGNTLSGGGRVNTWDSQNRMVSCVNTNAAGVTTTSQFTYACDGLRHRSVTNGQVPTDFVLDNSMFVREMSGGAVKATYFMGASGPAYRRDDTTGQVRWYLYDGLGSVLGEVDPQGNITAKRKYDVYGLSRSVTGTPTSKHAFVGSLGHPSEDETGLVYMQSRYYDPVVGRFASEDTALNGTNWFAYCANNPVNLTDANGKEPFANLITKVFLMLCLFAEWFGSAVAFLALLKKAYLLWQLVSKTSQAAMQLGRSMTDQSWIDETGVSYEMGVAMMDLAAKTAIAGAIAFIVAGWTMAQWVLIWHIDNDVNETPGLQP